MPYKMNEAQFQAVNALASDDRCSHFVSKVGDWQQLWAVRNDEGLLVPITPEGLEYLPVWPHPEYAQRIVDEHFPGHEAVEISLDDFLEDLLPKCQEDNTKIAVFPNNEWTFWVMEPVDLSTCLKEETAQYE